MTSLFFSSLCRKGMQWILYMIILFEKRESGSNSQELVFQMIGKCKIEKLQIVSCKLLVLSIHSMSQNRDGREEKRPATGETCWSTVEFFFLQMTSEYSGWDWQIEPKPFRQLELCNGRRGRLEFKPSTSVNNTSCNIFWCRRNFVQNMVDY